MNITLTAIRKHIKRNAWNGRSFVSSDKNADVFHGMCEYAATAISEMLTDTGGLNNNEHADWSLRVRGWYTGQVEPGTGDWIRNQNGIGVAHSWVVFEGKIIDPTCWAFDNSKPRVYIFDANDPRYVPDESA